MARSLRQFAQATEIRVLHRRPRLDFRAGDGHPALDDDIHLDLVLVPVVKELTRRLEPTRLPAQLLIRECLYELPQQFSVARERCRIHAEQSAGETRIPHMNLRRLDQMTQAIAVPRRKSLQQEYSFE